MFEDMTKHDLEQRLRSACARLGVRYEVTISTDVARELLREAASDSATAERSRCEEVCRNIGLAHQQTEGTYAAGKKAGAFECADAIGQPLQSGSADGGGG